MQLRAKQTSLEPLPAGRARRGRTPFVSQPSGRQPVRERSRRTQRPRVTNPQAPAVDLNKLPVLARSGSLPGASLCAADLSNPLVLLKRDGYVCQLRLPGCTGRATQVDHIIPVDDGGPWYEPELLRASCEHCNKRRGAIRRVRGGRTARPSREW